MFSGRLGQYTTRLLVNASQTSPWVWVYIMSGMKGSIGARSNIGLQVYKANGSTYKIAKTCSLQQHATTNVKDSFPFFLVQHTHKHTSCQKCSFFIIFWNKKTYHVFLSFLSTAQQRGFWSRQKEALWASRSDEQTVPQRKGDREPQAVGFFRSSSSQYITTISVYNIQYYIVLQIFLAPINWIT